MNELENFCFEIISNAGSSRSDYIEAIQYASDGDFKKAEELILSGEKGFSGCHAAHAKLLSEQAKNGLSINEMLLMHAEDLMMSAENFGIIAKKDLKLYKILYQLKDQQDCNK